MTNEFIRYLANHAITPLRKATNRVRSKLSMVWKEIDPIIEPNTGVKNLSFIFFTYYFIKYRGEESKLKGQKLNVFLYRFYGMVVVEQG